MNHLHINLNNDCENECIELQNCNEECMQRVISVTIELVINCPQQVSASSTITLIGRVLPDILLIKLLNTNIASRCRPVLAI